MVGKDIRRALIMVPHQDDEISVAGALLSLCLEKQWEVFVCYTTNGDYEVNAEIRLEEARKAMKILGVDKEHLIILGYPDTSNEDGENHIYYYERDKSLISRAGYSQTYGTNAFTDYATIRTAESHAYTRKNYHDDVKALIQELLPDFLVCVDMDKHVDHRMLSLVFERVMGEILKENREYKPVVWKAFSYGTGFNAPRDYWQVNLNKTVKPITWLDNNEGKLDNPFYDWDKRIRIPVKSELYDFPITKGRLYQALQCYSSQKAVYVAELIINSDQVFWERRTDNLLLNAQISATSGNVQLVHDFMLFDADAIHEEHHVQMSGMWCPEIWDEQKSIKIRLTQKQGIESLSLWGIGTDMRVIVRANKKEYTFEKATLYGEWNLKLPQIEETEEISLSFSYCLNQKFGIGELEVFKEQEKSLQYIKILVDDLMVDTFYACMRMPNIGLYRYYKYNQAGDLESLRIFVNGQPVSNFRDISKRRYRRKRMKIEVQSGEVPEIRDSVEVIFLSPYEWVKRKKQLKNWKQNFVRDIHANDN